MRRSIPWVRRIGDLASAAVVFHRAGLVDVWAVRTLLAVRRWGPIAGGVRIAGARAPDEVAIVDDRGAVTFGELDRRSDALAEAWSGRGIGADDCIGVLCRNHRGLVESLAAGAKLGARLVLMNTGTAGPEAAAIVDAERVTILVHDEEFTAAVAGTGVARFVAWAGSAARTGPATSVDELISSAPVRRRRPPRVPSEIVLLTSGTTGRSKGAPRRVRSAFVATQLLERVPLRAGERTAIAVPLFYGAGFFMLSLSLALRCPIVLRRRFEADTLLRDAVGCTAIVAVPTMVRRMLAAEATAAYGLPALRVLLVSGEPLTTELGNRARERFGDVVHNLYGSIEVGAAAIATPADWRAAPGTVGRPPRGCLVKILDADDRPVRSPGAIGRVFAGSTLRIDRYTDGRGRAVVDGLMCTGDLGHFDADGRLFVDGRADDMIISGGENVFPAEVEDVLDRHPLIQESVVTGIDDPDFGSRLRAFVVAAPGAALTGDDVRRHVRANLARYKVPRDVVFVSAVPRNAAGKPLRGRLAATSR